VTGTKSPPRAPAGRRPATGRVTPSPPRRVGAPTPAPPRATIDFAKVKLVVWDLDDTFWSGILAEGGIELRRGYVQAVKTLSRNGIISSICSNNDLRAARRELEKAGVWQHFVFPQIAWARKPAMIRAILESVQLRPANTVFLDDTARVREEVTAAFPDLLAVCGDEAFQQAFAGAFPRGSRGRDPRMTRLAQYKTLEARAAARSSLNLAPQQFDPQFLKKSNIRCYLFQPGFQDQARIHELINRTNQLNFTKLRLTEEETARLLKDPGTICRAIHVRDRFGDYGVCGFFALDRDNRLRHFLFSCRVLQMGIEQAVYQHLRRPPLRGPEKELCKTVVEPPYLGEWVAINLGPAPPPQDPPLPHAEEEVRAPLRILFIGGCEVEALSRYFTDARYPGGPVRVAERKLIHDEGQAIDFWGHRLVMRRWLDPRAARASAPVLDEVPWLHPLLFKDHFVPGEFDVVFMSVQQDYYSADYRHIPSGLVVPYYYFQMGRRDVMAKENWDLLVQRSGSYTRVGRSWPRRFARQWECLGPVTPSTYERALRGMVAALAPTASIICLNAAEVERWTSLRNRIDYLELDDMIAQARHQARLNAVVDRVARDCARFTVVDVRKHFRSEADGRDLMHMSYRAAVNVGLEALAAIRRVNQERAADTASIEAVDRYLSGLTTRMREVS
jgi:FkbH-like protein